jgi:FecR protein
MLFVVFSFRHLESLRADMWLRKTAIVVAIAMILCAGRTLVSADGEVGKITQVAGKAQVKRGKDNLKATAQMPVLLHDELRTGIPGEMTVEMIDNSTLTLNESSILAIDESIISGGVRTNTNLSLLSGSVHSLVSAVTRRSAPSFSVTTPNAIAGVRGTDFTCRYDKGKARPGFPKCFEFTDCATTTGSVVVSNNPPKKGVFVKVGPGQRTTVACFAAPLAPTPSTLGVLSTTTTTAVTSTSMVGPAAIAGAGLVGAGVIGGTTAAVVETAGGGGGGSAATASPKH